MQRYVLRQMTMEFLKKQNDDPEFVDLVRQVISGCTTEGFPNEERIDVSWLPSVYGLRITRSL